MLYVGILHRVRSIPACAGEPRCCTSWPRWGRVYPRVCGGTAIRCFILRDHRGLSPRVRGNRPVRQSPNVGRRSIPACAGEPTCPAIAKRRKKVYPRVCGGTWRGFPPVALEEGLSPRVRGNPIPVRRCNRVQRSIPACAGEPPTSVACLRTVPVYPRVCGGTLDVTGYHEGGTGLSPRVRGNPIPVRRCNRVQRSIPACAGEPPTSVACLRTVPVYPRVCGGTLDVTGYHEGGTGLSPRVRGNLRPYLRQHPQVRSIPACAGEPLTALAVRVAGRVYPRVCGGTHGGLDSHPRIRGLSPRVRGNQYEPAAGYKWSRSIPACAGEPRSTGTCRGK